MFGNSDQPAAATNRFNGLGKTSEAKMTSWHLRRVKEVVKLLPFCMRTRDGHATKST